MNSESLQESFPEIYQEFFSKCSIATSASGAFWIAGEYAILYGGLGIFQKVPLKVYIGLKPTDDGSVSDGGGYVFNPAKQCFDKIVLSKILYAEAHEKLSALTKKYLEDVLGDRYQGLSYFYIIEAPVANGYNTSATFAVTLATSILLFAKQIEPSVVEEINQRPVSELPHDTDFNTIFRFACKFEAIFHGGASAGSSVFASCVKSAYPIIFFTEKREGRETPTHGARLPAYSKSLDLYDQFAYRGLSLDELGGISGDWPIDFGIIYSGDYMPAANVIRSIADFENELEKTYSSARKKIGKIANAFPSGLLARSLDVKDAVFRNYVRAVNATAVEVFVCLYNLLNLGASDPNFKELAEAINASQNALALFNVSSEKLNYICNIMLHEANKLDEPVGCKMSGPGKKGPVLFVAPYRGLRDNIDSIIEKLRKNTKEKTLSIQYLSWLDGIGKEGVTIEQCLDHKIYSDYISAGAVKITHLSTDGSTQIQTQTKEEYETTRATADIVLDASENDIFIRGKKITSKEIYTSRETIAILTILISEIKKWVSHKKFPPSSYASDRSEFQSKIISPLNKTLEKHLGKKLKLSMSGSAVDFSVKLEPGLGIYIAEEKF